MSKKFGFSAGLITILMGLVILSPKLIVPEIPSPLAEILTVAGLVNLVAGTVTIIATIKKIPPDMKDRYLSINLFFSFIGICTAYIAQLQNLNPFINALAFWILAIGSTGTLVWTMGITINAIRGKRSVESPS